MTVNKLSLVALSNLNLVGTITEALQECSKNETPVFISCPEMVTVWAIANDFAETVNSYKKLKENDFKEAHLSVARHDDYKLFKAIKGRSKLPHLIDEQLQYLQLNEASVKSLTYGKRATAYNFSHALIIGGSGLIEWIEFIETYRYMPSILSASNFSEGSKNQDVLSLKFLHSEFTFNTCHKGMKRLGRFDDPLNDFTSIKINLDDCFIFEKDSIKLTSFTVDNIPEGSPYYVPLNCRSSSKMNKLAVLGHRFYIDKSMPIPKNVAKYIEVELSVKKKEAGIASFFINPKPAGQMKECYKGQAQFQNLVKVYIEVHIDKKLDTKRLTSKSKIPVDTFTSYGYAPEKCDGAVKLITPDN